MIFSRCKTEKYIFGFGIHLEFGFDCGGLYTDTGLGLDLGFGSGIQGSGSRGYSYSHRENRGLTVKR